MTEANDCKRTGTPFFWRAMDGVAEVLPDEMGSPMERFLTENSLPWTVPVERISVPVEVDEQRPELPLDPQEMTIPAVSESNADDSKSNDGVDDVPPFPSRSGE